MLLQKWPQALARPALLNPRTASGPALCPEDAPRPGGCGRARASRQRPWLGAGPGPGWAPPAPPQRGAAGSLRGCPFPRGAQRERGPSTARGDPPQPPAEARGASGSANCSLTLIAWSRARRSSALGSAVPGLPWGEGARERHAPPWWASQRGFP